MSLPVCLWLSGDETLLIEEALIPLRQQARSEGYTREILQIGAHFDWSIFRAQCQSLSLFSDKQFIECRLEQPKLSEDGKEALTDYLSAPCPEICVIITSGKIDSTMQKTAWFKKLSSLLKFQPIWPLQASGFRQWIQSRASSQGLKLTGEAVEYLAAQTEGNLLAAKQAVERLSLMADSQPLTVERLRELQHDASVYDLFDLVDTALSGNALKTVHVFHQLLAQATAPVLMLWALNREVNQLLSMKTEGATPYILPHRKALIGKALQRLDEATLKNILAPLGVLDACLKGLGESDGLNELLDQYLALSGNAIPGSSFRIS